ncbi:MAG: bifunctional salicylyl-CoA 5-hydroxylase/oxidoreductase [Planctomycetota bacterium]|nr:bifunctional salicylyl-CoA 5-hydroxylase/oxidoreductase [Planctomycetota bacterium]
MRILGVGAGPGNLYFSILMKKAFPEAEIRLMERNSPDATFGWGVVFSDETLGHFEVADPESYARITEEFAYWTDIDNFHQDVCVRSTGHGFCGMSRKRLLQIFHARCEELGVAIEFERDVEDIDAVKADCDLLLGGDGVKSLIRDQYAETFQPSLDWRKCKFTWLGTDKPLEAFTFIFRANEAGLFQVHAYPFEPNLSTFIVECHEDVWKRAGLDQASEEETIAYFEALFADHLEGGYRLLGNKSIWRTFPTVRNACWHHENVVLLGDAAHTAHFSIGSGTKLAMEDAISLVEAFKVHGTDDVPKVLAAYEASRRLEEIKIQKAAQPSLEWFEHTARYMDQDPIQFTFNLMTRSKRITYDNLAVRDPEFIERVAANHAENLGITTTPPPAPMFTPFTAGNMELANRVVVSPMCMYSAVDGTPNDWHLVHLGALAVGGAGLVITEMTNVSAEGRITHGCAGIYSDENEAGWKRVVDFVHEQSAAKIGMQLGHAGRKASCNLPWEGDDPLRDDTAWTPLGPSATPFDADWPTPHEMSREDMDRVTAEYVEATQRAARAGFDMVELHMAHGYLLSTFISPLSNRRTDDYGGSLGNRARFPLEVLRAVREAWPAEKPVFVRISATDWLDDEGGLTIDESVELARMLKANGCAVVDVSTAGNVPESAPEYGRMYQVPFAERIRYEAEVPVMAVGAILGADHVNTIVAAGRADLCALARPHLINPHLTMQAAGRYFADDQPWPRQYLPARPKRKQEPPSFLERLGRQGPRIRHAPRRDA